MKQLANHFQQISMISLVDLGWTPDIKSYFSFQDYFLFVSEEFISVDCFVQNWDYNLLTVKIIFSNIMPILLSLCALLIWMTSFTFQLARKRTPSNDYIINRILVTSLVIIFFLFPEILRKCFSLMNCMTLDDNTGQKGLTISPDVKCWESDHKSYVTIAALPGILMWGFLTPLFLWFLLYKHRSQIVNRIKQSKRMSKPIQLESSKVENVIEELRAKQSLFESGETVYPEGTHIPSIFVGKVKEPIDGKKVKRRGNIFEIKNNDKSPNERGQTINFSIHSSKVDNYMVEGEESIGTGNLIKKHKGQENFRSLNSRSSAIGAGGSLPEDLLQQRENNLQFEDLNEKMQVSDMLKFLYKGYNHQFYYWELVMFTKKFFLIFIGSFTEFFPSTTKATILLIVLALYLFIQIRFKPFETEFLNQIEFFSIFVTFITANMGIMLFSDDLKAISELYLSIIIIVNLAFLYKWLKTFLKYAFRKGVWQFIKENIFKRIGDK